MAQRDYQTIMLMWGWGSNCQGLLRGGGGWSQILHSVTSFFCRHMITAPPQYLIECPCPQWTGGTYALFIEGSIPHLSENFKNYCNRTMFSRKNPLKCPYISSLGTPAFPGRAALIYSFVCPVIYILPSITTSSSRSTSISFPKKDCR